MAKNSKKRETKFQKELRAKIAVYIDENVLTEWTEDREYEFAYDLIQALSAGKVTVKAVNDFMEACGSASNLRDERDNGKASECELEDEISCLWDSADKLIAKAVDPLASLNLRRAS